MSDTEYVEFLKKVAARIRERRLMFVCRPPILGEEAALRGLHTAVGRLSVAVNELQREDARKALVEAGMYLGILWEIEDDLSDYVKIGKADGPHED